MITTQTKIRSACAKCGNPRDSEQSYCRSCFAAYARERRKTLASQGKRCWTNTSRDRMRTFHFCGPTWISPAKVPEVIATISASIVWGIYGKMADVQEY